MTKKQPSEDTNNSPWVIVYLLIAFSVFTVILVLVGLVIVATRVAPHVPAF